MILWIYLVTIYTYILQLQYWELETQIFEGMHLKLENASVLSYLHTMTPICITSIMGSKVFYCGRLERWKHNKNIATEKG